MTDSKLRELERRWKETGSVENEAAYLLERVRVGDLEKEKLELAAYCGHEGARTALVDTVGRPDDLELWARGLVRWGADSTLQFCLGILRELADQSVDGESSRSLVGLVQKWLDSHSPAVKEQIRDLPLSAAEQAQWPDLSSADHARRTAAWVVKAVIGHSGTPLPLRFGLRDRFFALEPGDVRTAAAVSALSAVQATGDSTLPQRVAAELGRAALYGTAGERTPMD